MKTLRLTIFEKSNGQNHTWYIDVNNISAIEVLESGNYRIYINGISEFLECTMKEIANSKIITNNIENHIKELKKQAEKNIKKFTTKSE